MASDPLILAIDTTAAHCAAALLSGDRILAHRFEPMIKGQAERLMPMIEEILQENGQKPGDLDGIAVCTGPGNFTGIRIAVAAARGLALSLGIPAIGVSRLEALSHGILRPVAALLDGRQDHVFEQPFKDGKALRDPVLMPLENLPDDADYVTLSGDLDRLALPRCTRIQPDAIVLNIAHVAAGKLGQDLPRPAPVYVRAANAALPTEPPPVLLP